MKRLILAVGIGAAAMAISTPASAQTGCRWYDVNCRLATGDVRRTDGTVDGSWQIIGRDANGNEIYQRRRVDGNGNVVIERARRDGLGRMVIIDRDVNTRNTRNDQNVLNSRRYEQNGMICKYKENSRGYQEKCKYAKNKAGRLYRINDVYRGGVYRDGVYRDAIYRDDDDRTNRVYRTNKVNGDKYKTANVNGIYGGKNKADKVSSKYNKVSNKSNKSNGKAKGHNKH